MTIEELAQRAGMSTANVRFYEQCGFISPGNRYGAAYGGNYDTDHLDTLLKVRLLRELGISIDKIKELFANRLSLGQVLEERLNQPSGSSVPDGSGSPSQNISEIVCRGLLMNNEEFDSLNPEPYLRQLSSAPEVDLPKSDSYYFPGPWRRYFARMVDLSICSLLWGFFLWIAFKTNLLGRNIWEDILDTAVGLLLMLFLEPLLLHVFGTTPGKFLLGMKVRDIGGDKLSYSQGLYRTFGVIFWGMGLSIPIYSLFRLWKSRKGCLRGEELPWEDTNHIELYKSRWHVPAFILSYCALTLVTSVLLLRSQMPIYRGDMTAAEFAENFAHMAYVTDVDLGYALTSDGTWEEENYNGQFNLSIFSYGALPALDMTSDNGELTSVSMGVYIDTGDSEYISNVNTIIQLLSASFVGAQSDVRILSNDLAHILSDSRIDDLEGFAFSAYGVDVSCEIDSRGYEYWDSLGGYLALDGDYEGEPYFSLIFSMEKEDI